MALLNAPIVQSRRYSRLPDRIVGVDRKMKAFVYILKDETGKFYIGSTFNIEKRLKQHTGHHTQTTRNMLNPKLVLKQEYPTLLIARRVESKIKRLKRKDYIEKMVLDGYIKLAV